MNPPLPCPRCAHPLSQCVSRIHWLYCPNCGRLATRYGLLGTRFGSWRRWYGTWCESVLGLNDDGVRA